MTMLRTLLCTAAVVLLCAWPAQAQRNLTLTTLSANVAAADNTISVTSTTGFTVGQLLKVDWEVMRIQSLNGVAGTSTLVSVTRGVDGTARRAHDNTESVWVTVIATDFKNTDPDWGADCARGSGQAAILPWINTSTGTVWECIGVRWSGSNTMPLTYNSTPSSSP